MQSIVIAARLARQQHRALRGIDAGVGRSYASAAMLI